jgi:hypothetical protein
MAGMPISETRSHVVLVPTRWQWIVPKLVTSTSHSRLQQLAEIKLSGMAKERIWVKPVHLAMGSQHEYISAAH